MNPMSPVRFGARDFNRESLQAAAGNRPLDQHRVDRLFDAWNTLKPAFEALDNARVDTLVYGIPKGQQGSPQSAFVVEFRPNGQSAPDNRMRSLPTDDPLVFLTQALAKGISLLDGSHRTKIDLLKSPEYRTPEDIPGYFLG